VGRDLKAGASVKTHEGVKLSGQLAKTKTCIEVWKMERTLKKGEN